MQDNRSRFLHNEGARRANEVRQRRATVENPQWAMSRPAEWYKNKENLASVRDTLSQVRGNRDFFTTDQDESRSMYQMILNNMYGGGGARMLDLRNLPAAVQADPNKYRRGRTLFQDPSKSQGLFGDLASMVLRRPNPAAVRAKEYNPFHDHGYARDWYMDQFGQPMGEKLTGIFKLAAPGPLKFIKGKEREPLPSDRSWIPEGVGSYKQAPMIDLEAMDGDIQDGVGIAGVVDSDPEERAEYAERTFGPMEQSDDYVEDDFGAFYTDENTLASERVLPFEDSGREAGIASLYGQGPQFGTTNRRYENEYRDFLASQSDTMRQFGPITYEEFADAYERMYQGKPQIGFR